MNNQTNINRIRIMNILTIITLIFLSNCKKDTDCCVVNNLEVSFSVKSSTGADLLNPQTINSFNKDNIDLYYHRNGNYVKVFDDTKDFPKNFYIYKSDSGDFLLKVYVNPQSDLAGQSLTLIKFGQTVPDTIKTEINKNGSSTAIRNASLNSVPFDHNKVFLIKK